MEILRQSRRKTGNPSIGACQFESVPRKEGSCEGIVTLRGVVDKIVPSVGSTEPEKMQIVIKSADDLYREIRIENVVENGAGEKLKLQVGTEVNITISVRDVA
jgi:hypothetical protein